MSDKQRVHDNRPMAAGSYGQGLVWTVKSALRTAAQVLAKHGIDSPRLSAELLLAHALDVARLDLYLDHEKPLTRPERAAFRDLLKRRLQREPLQYITGVQEFWSLPLEVSPAVLVPRPETEILVEESVRRLQGCGEKPRRRAKILELGTGCGAVALALAKELQPTFLLATDISAAALEVARHNARRHEFAGCIQFLLGDLLEPLRPAGSLFDLIVSNPPYVATEEYSSLPPEVGEHEPRRALDGGKGGMDFIARIIAGAAGHLKAGGWLLLEMDPRQTSKAIDLLNQSGAYSEAERIRDYSGRYRVVAASKLPA